MANTYVVPLARALYGAVFMQYLLYMILYIIEGCKFDEINKERILKDE
jgi:hypothetical protein